MNKKIIFVGLVFVLFAGVFLSANSANAAFWDWFRGRSDNTAAVAKAARVALKVEKSGKGVVTSDDGKINCRKDCSEVYYSGGSVTLKAIPADGFNFEKWTGNACVSFVSFSASTEEGASGACSVSLDYNKNKTITATAHFKKTSGSSSSKSSALPSNPPIDAGTLPTTGTCTVTDDGVTVCTDTSVGTASSAASSSKSKSSSSSATSTVYMLKINKSGKGNISDGGRLNCGGVCAEKYWPGSEVKIRAVPNGGYVFKKFTPEKECSSIYSDGFGFNDNKLIKQAFAYGAAENVVCVTTMNKNKTITAVFEKIKK